MSNKKIAVIQPIELATVSRFYLMKKVENEMPILRGIDEFILPIAKLLEKGLILRHF